MLDQYATPILLIIFNRPDLAKVMLKKLRIIKPAKLYIAADGPRENHPTDAKNCRETREIMKNIDWNCEVKTLYREKNLGCKYAVSSSITWFFKHVNQGIILEDDCVPHTTFFRFAEELLIKYKNDERVASIGGSHPYDDKVEINESYFFSKYSRIWGWATWKSVWDTYDVEISFWPQAKKDKVHHNFFASTEEIAFWESIWDRCYQKKINTWDYQFLLCRLMQSGLTVVPKANLISNIGFRKDATHTTDAVSALANYPTTKMSFPLIHPTCITPNYKKDAFLSKDKRLKISDIIRAKLEIPLATTKHIINSFTRIS